MADDDMLRVDAKCPHCKTIDTFYVPRSGFERRARGAHLLEAFPDLDLERIVQLAHHACPRCQLTIPKLKRLRESLKKP